MSVETAEGSSLMCDNHEGSNAWMTQTDRLLPIFDAIVCESDRGAVLIAMHIIDDALLTLLRKHKPNSVNRDSFKQLTGFGGPLGTLSGKVKTLHLLGVLTDQSHNAIDRLRKVRNRAAHSEEPFILIDHVAAFQCAQREFGDNSAVSNLALELLMSNFLRKMVSTGTNLEEKIGNNPFPDFDACLSYIEQNSELYSLLESQRPRWELAVLTYLVVETLSVNFANWQGKQ